MKKEAQGVYPAVAGLMQLEYKKNKIKAEISEQKMTGGVQTPQF